MDYRIEKSKSTIFEKIWLTLILILVAYSFYFQYAIKSIDGLMIILCGAIILCACIQIFWIQKGTIEVSMMVSIIVYVVLSAFITITITSHGRYGTDVCIRMVEYVFTAYSLFLILKDRLEYLRVVLWMTCVSVAFLAITTLTSGVVVTSTGAIGLAGLNTNSMSSFFILAVFACFVLVSIEKKMIIKLFLAVCMIVIVLSMISAASRRGFIVLSALIGLSLLFGIVPLKSKNKSRTRWFLTFFIILLVVVTFAYVQNYLLENTVLGSRLTGSMDTGDMARDKYQNFAKAQFESHPILGIGLGGIKFYMGAYSHSLYYEVFSCTGIILSVFLLLVLLKYGIKLFHNQKLYKNKDKVKCYLMIEGFLYWLCILVSGISMVMIYDLYFYLSLAILAAMLEIVESQKEIF